MKESTIPIYKSPLLNLDLSFVEKKVKHVHGPMRLDYKSNDVMVLCLVQNGEYFIDEFVEHYFTKGFKHFIFLDNNSKDNTVKKACRYKNITLLSTKLPFKHYQYDLRQYLIQKFSIKKWSLCVDIDEFFDWPYSDNVSLHSLIKYLNTNKYTAVIAQMLDMFPEKELNRISKKQNIKDECIYYDISDISRYPYANDHYNKNINDFTNIKSNDSINSFFGGIRKTLFNINDLYLTKHPLIFLDEKIKPQIRVHLIESAKIADFSCVLYHYKFTHDFIKKAQKASRKGNYRGHSAEYKKYLQVIKKKPNLCIKQETSKKLEAINQLIKSGFLSVSQNYLEYVNTYIR